MEPKAEEPHIILDNLHEQHPGLTPELSGALCQAARVCMDRHHVSPNAIGVFVEEVEHSRELFWKPATAVEKNANANTLDATRDGAYALGLLSVETTLGLVAIGRAEELTGADWYVSPVGQKPYDAFGFPNLDAPNVHRLEVSGQDKGSLGARMTEKRKQLKAGHSALSGYAVVVGFERAIVRIRLIEEN